ncbi:exportin-T isoform X2 [Physcomitrium patens]|uniref:Exportin-T n=1 Tax=Physcomitrium patens TaxID=3218 RepID=A9SRJ5_PHYPA|nr:exportin-T-like isoform X2 [Physcomitrium patens]PNR44194.1 hypothetical protein PHYPA_016578 [Physcomitrium patens]|eukprot:XP_024390921.1 exportin-T-like isoform X2 [Physcomitrella patens]
MEDFEKAVLFSFDQSGAVSDELKAQAAAYCEQVKQAPNIIEACLEKIRISQYAEVQFWCLKTLEEVMQQRYKTLDSQKRLFIRSSLMLAFCNFNLDDASITDSAIPLSSRPVFIRNKLAQLIVILIYLEYPAEWPSAFLDMLGSLSKGPVVVDMFIRVLNALDEEVISFDFPRTEEEAAAATRIKDAMRQQCISQVVAAWYNLIVMYKGQSPQLAAQVLEMMQKYVAWIDIGLVANDSFVPLLFEFLVSSHEYPQLRGAAAECLLAIVSKRMDAPSKLALLQQLQAGKACSTIMEEQEPEFALKLTALLTGIATEVLECSKRIEVNGACEQSLALAELVTVMLDEVLPPVFYFMQNGDEDMSTTTFQFLNSYVTRMKNSKPINGKQATHLGQILAVVFTRMRYDPSYKDSIDEPDKSGLEEEERMAEYRKEIMGLFRSINRVAPEVTKTFVESTLARILQDSSAEFEDVEAAIVLLRVLGEGVTEESMKPENRGPLREMVGAFLSMSIPCHSHRLIAILYLETVTRYVKFVQYHPEYIPRVLSAFLDARGMHHPNPQVSSRASYLFMRFVKVLRIQLVPYLENILQSLEDLLSSVTLPKPLLKKDADERSYMFEAVGLLIGMEDLAVEKQATFLSALLVPLCGQVEAMLSRDEVKGDPIGPTPITMALQQIIMAISYLGKGFGEHLATNGRPVIGNMFKQTLDVVLRVIPVFPQNKVLRSKVTSFLHQMVETLGGAVLPALPTIIQQLLTDCEPKDLVEFIQLINQLINKFKVGMMDILQEIFPVIVGRVFAILPQDGFSEGPGSLTEEVRELLDLQRNYFLLIHAMTTQELSPVMLSQKSSPLLQNIIGLLLDASCNHKDVLVRKICVQVFNKLIADWCVASPEEEKVPGFRQFLVERFAAECCIYKVSEPSFNFRDANTVALFGEIVTAQKLLYEKCGNDLLMHLATKVLPAVHCPPNLAEQFCLHIQRSDVKELKPLYKSFIEKLRPQQQQNGHAWSR